MAELGKREIGLIEDGIKTIYDELFSLGVSKYIDNANDFRQSILQVLIQGTNDSNYATHANILFNAFKPIEDNFSQLKLETVIDYVKTNYDVLNETGQLSDIDIPEMMWTGYDDTANALEDIAIYLNDNYDFEIDTKNIDNILVDMSEQLMGSDIKVGDIPDALEIQIRVLDDLQYHEIAQMYTTWPSTEMMRPLTIQLTEIYNQVDNLDVTTIDSLYNIFSDYLYIGNEASDIVIGINNPDNLKTVGVKNMIKYYFEQLGRLQTSYTEFSGANHAFLDGWQISNELDVPLSIAGDVGQEVSKNLDKLLWNSKNPAQFLATLKPFEGVMADIPYQVSSDYFKEYQNIIGKYVSKYFTDPNFASTIAEGKDLYTFINEDLKIAGYNLEETPDSEFLNRLSKTTEEDILKGTSIDTPTNLVDGIKLTGTMGGNTTPTGTNIAYANVEDLEQFIQFDRKAEGNAEKINEIKKSISSKGYLYDTAYDSGVVFGVTVDELGNVQIAEGNHRLQALIDFARETGQEIYVPINPVLASTGAGNKVQLTNTDNAYNSMKQLLTDMLEDNKNFDLDYTIKTKLGEPGRKISGLDSYTYPGGAPGTSTNQSNIKKFFNSIGLNTITYDELPDNNIYKTGVNAFTDTPTNVVDDLEDAIIKSDGLDNLNKAKKVIGKNPGVFRKILSVLEKADVGDQVITKFVLPKVLPAIGLGTVAAPLGIAYAVYETALLLSDVGQAAYKAQTTDESFWDNFGEVSDKYSIAYKISKPVYDIILDSLNEDLATEDKNEAMLFSFNR